MSLGTDTPLIGYNMSIALVKSDWMRETMPSTRKLRTKLVLGWGINDADYVIDPSKTSGIGPCPAYQAWQRMLLRCYSEAFLLKNPTYKGVTVCEDWRKFSSFREWWTRNVADGYELDKDLLNPGNKVYSPDACIFVPKWLNTLANGHEAGRGELPIGVYFHKREKRYRAQVALCTGVQKTLGSFRTKEEAHSAWLDAKLKYASSRKSEMDAIDERLYPNIVTIIRGKK